MRAQVRIILRKVPAIICLVLCKVLQCKDIDPGYYIGYYYYVDSNDDNVLDISEVYCMGFGPICCRLTSFLLWWTTVTWTRMLPYLLI